jgi:hypothetical protein
MGQCKKDYLAFMNEKNPPPCSHFILCHSKRIKFTLATNLLMIQFSIIVKATHILWKLNFLFHLSTFRFYICLFYIICASYCAKEVYTLDSINSIQYSYFLIVTADQRIIGYRRFGLSAFTYLHVEKYFWLFDPWVLDHTVVSKFRVPMSK